MNIEKELEENKPDKFASENCHIFCGKSCDDKYKKVLINISLKVNKVRREIENLRKIIFYYIDGKEKKEKYRENLLRKLDYINKYVKKIDEITKKKAYEYNFNYQEIISRGNLYKKKLLDIKAKIKEALKNDNFYLFSKFINEGIGTGILAVFNEFKDTFKELDRDYFVVLKDKKIEYKALISVYSWNDNLDYPTEHTTNFDVSLPKDLFEKLYNFYKKTNGDKALCWGSFYGRVSCNIEDKRLEKLIETLLLKIPYNDTDFEVYIEDIYPVYYHKYLILEKGKTKEEKWVEVDEKTYKNFNIINTVVMAKPLGYFEDQLVVKPTEIYKTVINNPYYIHPSTSEMAYILWLIRNKLPEISIPDKKYPQELEREIKYRYFSRKKVLSDYAKKYGLDKKKLEEYREKEKIDKLLNENYSSSGSTGGLRTIGSRYRGGGYGGFGK